MSEDCYIEETKKTITENGKTKTFYDITEKDKDYDNIINTEKYYEFLKDIGVDYLDSDKNVNTKITNEYRNDYLRKVLNYETTNYYRGFINWKTYNDKTPDIKMNSSTVEKLRGAKIIYFAYFSFNETEESTPIINQLIFLNSLNHYGVGEINIVLPYFPLGTMERIVGEGEIPTAYALANMINSIPSGAAKNNLYIFDIHALCSRFFFHTNTIPILISLMPDYVNFILNNYNESDGNLNIIVFPDDGAKKRFDKLLGSNFKRITCGKIRDGEKRIIKIESGMENLIQNNDGKKGLISDKKINMFIIDDLVQSGGTLTETIKGIINYLLSIYPNDCKFIKNIKFTTIVTHSVFPTLSNTKKFFNPNENVNLLVTSNTRPFRVKQIQNDYPNKIEVINIAPVLHKIFTNQEHDKYIAPYSIH